MVNFLREGVTAEQVQSTTALEGNIDRFFKLLGVFLPSPSVLTKLANRNLI